MTKHQIQDVLNLLESKFLNVRRELVLVSSIYDKEIKLRETESFQKRIILILDYKHCSWNVETFDMWINCKPLNLLFPIIVQQYLLFKLESPTITLEQLSTILAIYSRISKRDVKEEVLTSLKELLSKSITL